MKLKVFAIVAARRRGRRGRLRLGRRRPAARRDANTTQYLTAAATTGDVTDTSPPRARSPPTRTYDLGFGAAPVLRPDSSAAAGSGTWTVTEVTARSARP